MFFPLPRVSPLTEGVLAVGPAAGLAYEGYENWERTHSHPRRPPPSHQQERVQKALEFKEESYTTRMVPLRLSFFTWNVDAQSPEALRSGPSANQALLRHFLESLDQPDVIHFGLQEVIELSNKKLEVETKLFATQHRPISHKYDDWKEYLTGAIEDHFDHFSGGNPDEQWDLVGEEKLVGLYTLVFARGAVASQMRNIHFSRVKLGMDDKLGNKGSLAYRFTINDSSFCLLNNHLAAGQGKGKHRERDVVEVFKKVRFKPLVRATGDDVVSAGAFEDGGDGSRVLDHEFVFFAGDTNSRLVGISRQDVLAALAAPQRNLNLVLAFDELTNQLSTHGPPLASFCEQEINFEPTYKFDHGTDTYDTSKKQRTPAWCDRVLWRAREEKVRAISYARLEPDISDHRPVVASFECELKQVDDVERDKLKGDLASEMANGGLMPV